MKEQEALLQPIERAVPFERVPQELKSCRQWVNWKLVDDKKVPVNPSTMGNAGVGWESTWASFKKATGEATAYNLGLGFVLTEDDLYTCVDLDKCVGSHGQIDGRTRKILNLLSGWVELSPSGTGLHIWVRNEQPVSRRTTGLEVYSYSRWMSVTGRSNPNNGLEIPDRTAEVEELMERFMPRRESPSVPPEPVPMSDLEIWNQLFCSERGDQYARLYDGDLTICHGDHSLGVIMLANQLAWMTDYDPGRMKSLLYETKLMRDKWEQRRGRISWIDYQIQDAIVYVSGQRS